MGKVKQVLAKKELKDRDSHNSRVFVDRCENVHIHYREFRFVFSIKEFNIFAKAVAEGKVKLDRAVKDGYKEHPDNLTRIIGGRQSKNMPIKNPQRSAFFNNRFVIEEQANEDIDKFHIHYRDFRIVLDNEQNFMDFCNTVEEAKCKWLKSQS